MESFRIPEDSSIPRMSTYNRKRTCGEIGMGRGERRSQGKSWSPGCLQGAASSGPVVPLRTSLRLKCLGTLRAPLRTFLKHQSAVCAHTPPPPGSTLLPLLKGELRLHARSASAQAQPSHPAAQRGAPHPGPSFLPFSVQALRGPVYNYIGVKTNILILYIKTCFQPNMFILWF